MQNLTSMDLSHSFTGWVKNNLILPRSHNNLILKSNTCVLSDSSALSSGVVPAGNRILFQIDNSRKLPPPARFILPVSVFHCDKQPGKRTICHLK